jgi:hypothetical protein
VRTVQPEATLLLIFVFLLYCTNAVAQQEADADTREVQAYVLTEAGFTRYTQAARNLAALPQGRPGSCDNDSDTSSLAESVALLNSTPGAEAAIRSAGMTTHEYVVYSWSLVYNALAAWAGGEADG